VELLLQDLHQQGLLKCNYHLHRNLLLHLNESLMRGDHHEHRQVNRYDDRVLDAVNSRNHVMEQIYEEQHHVAHLD
jgi:hypothetical protein